MVAILGLAGSHIQRRRRSAAQPAPDRPDRAGLLRRLAVYANDAVLPFFVLHETVIVVVAYVVLAWPIGSGAQYCLIALGSLAATLLLYDLGIRRSPVTRFLFGQKPIRGPVRATIGPCGSMRGWTPTSSASASSSAGSGATGCRT